MKLVKFCGYDCNVEKLFYGNGRPALQLVSVDGEPVATATVNLPDMPAGPNDVFIKDYSENEGILAALEEAGVVKVTGERIRAGFAQAVKAELLPPFRDRAQVENSSGETIDTGKTREL